MLTELVLPETITKHGPPSSSILPTIPAFITRETRVGGVKLGRMAAVRYRSGAPKRRSATKREFLSPVETTPFQARILFILRSAWHAFAIATPCHHTRPEASSRATKKPRRVSAYRVLSAPEVRTASSLASSANSARE